MNIKWKTGKFDKPFILHNVKAEEISEDMYVIFQIWHVRNTRETTKGNMKEIFNKYNNSLKPENGPFYFVYSEIDENTSGDIELTDIPPFE